MSEPITGGTAGDELRVTVRRSSGMPGELVLYGAFLVGMLIIYAAGVIGSQRRLAAQYRRIDAAMRAHRLTSSDVPPHTHSYADILAREPTGIIGVVPSDRDGSDVPSD